MRRLHISEGFLEAGRKIAAWWNRLSKREQRFATNVTIGIVLALALLAVETNAAIERLQDIVRTWQMTQFAGTDRGRDLVWIDVNDKTYQAWQSPFVTPRDKLCRSSIMRSPAERASLSSMSI
jgi:hypothetical protein